MHHSKLTQLVANRQRLGWSGKTKTELGETHSTWVSKSKRTGGGKNTLTRRRRTSAHPDKEEGGGSVSVKAIKFLRLLPCRRDRPTREVICNYYSTPHHRTSAPCKMNIVDPKSTSGNWCGLVALRILLGHFIVESILNYEEKRIIVIYYQI